MPTHHGGVVAMGVVDPSSGSNLNVEILSMIMKRFLNDGIVARDDKK